MTMLDDLYADLLNTMNKPDLIDWRPRDAYDHGVYDTLSELWKRGLLIKEKSDMRRVLRQTADDVELLMSAAWSRLTEVEHGAGEQIIKRINDTLAEA